ncbi:hypothetical protein [Couchioplanes caeruleus]|uniref:Serine-threonine protein kinase n=2 Tax=Couchioplanes caeruleus TaxID=56438 RepID=A0A1K0FQH2_9ACTN|nr:hypothetical protein [Couchioplanes caeruleus]OJF15033.1 hypothetical protein BG844_06795 [Couchioplanes caeruleus subsp. caeruleus]ROP28933.1 hypothetical protein EDD30_1712 [Couchioplanes caeruleus]
MHYWELAYDRYGTLTVPTETTFLDDLAAHGITDLFVFAHGWGSGEQRSRGLYRSLFPLIEGMAPGTAGFAGIFWPALWFPDPPPEAEERVRAAMEANRPGVADAVVSGAEIARSLVDSFEEGLHPAVTRMGELVDEGVAGVGIDGAEIQQARLDEFHRLLGTVFVTAPQAPEDSGEQVLLFADRPEVAYARIADILGSAPARGDERGFGDLWGKVWNGARDALRMASYYEMKGRAGDIGRRGLGPLLERLGRRLPGVRVHLGGHSFGARLISFALAGIGSAAASPVASVCLVQGAFSHYTFTPLSAMPFGSAGALHRVADRVGGPLVATFTRHDWALGRWYPKASFLARDDIAARVDPALRWGALGADGFRGATPARRLTVLPAGAAYGLAAGTFHSVDAARVIADTRKSAFSGAHSDIVHAEIAWLVAAAAAR